MMLARVRSHRAGGTCPAGCAPLSTGGCDCPYRSLTRRTLRGAQYGLASPFESWAWQNKTPLALGAAGLLGIGALVFMGKVLR